MQTGAQYSAAERQMASVDVLSVAIVDPASLMRWFWGSNFTSSLFHSNVVEC